MTPKTTTKTKFGIYGGQLIPETLTMVPGRVDRKLKPHRGK